MALREHSSRGQVAKTVECGGLGGEERYSPVTSKVTDATLVVVSGS